MEQTVVAWLTQYGAPALFALLMFGVFGIPIPDETLLVLAGVLVSRGELKALPTAGAGVGGAIVGITVSYALGRFSGFALLSRYGTALHVTPFLLARVRDWFDRYGKWLLTGGYFIPGVRHVTALVAGASGLSGWTFAVFAYGGALVWVSCFLLIGYVMGDDWHELVSVLHRRAIIVAVVAAAGTACTLWITRRGSGSSTH